MGVTHIWSPLYAARLYTLGRRRAPSKKTLVSRDEGTLSADRIYLGQDAEDKPDPGGYSWRINRGRFSETIREFSLRDRPTRLTTVSLFTVEILINSSPRMYAVHVLSNVELLRLINQIDS